MNLRIQVFKNLDVAFEMGYPIFDYGDTVIAQKIIEASTGKYEVEQLLPFIIEWKGKKFRALVDQLKALTKEQGITFPKRIN